MDADGKCLLVNPAGVELAGRPESELIGSSIAETYLPEERHLFKDRVDKLKAEGSFRFERKFLRKNCEVIPVEVSLSALRGRYYQAIIRDISQRKWREALSASESPLSTISRTLFSPANSASRHLRWLISRMIAL